MTALRNCLPGLESHSSDVANTQAFLRLVEEYIHSYYKFHPVRGPESGFHNEDGIGLDDMSTASISREVDMVRSFQQRLKRISKDQLSNDLSFDHDVFAAHLESRLYDLDEDRVFTRDPSFYADIIQTGIMYQILFDYPGTTKVTRLQIVLKQLDTVPALIQNAIQYLQSVPQELINHGLTCMSDTISFLSDDVPSAFRDVQLLGGLVTEHVLNEKIALATQSINGLIAHLKALSAGKESKPPFSLGETGLAKRLRVTHGICLPEKMPFEKILERTRAEIEENRTAFEQAAKTLDPSRSAKDVWAEVQTQHPKPGEVAAVVKQQMDTLVEFLKQKDLVFIPTDEVVEVKPSLPFMLYWYASCWSTGAFEAEPAPPAVYYVSDPAGILKGTNGQTDEDVQNKFLLAMVTPELWSTAAHEAYPGHFLQGYALKQVRRNMVDIGKLSMLAVCNIFMPYSLSEGWALYCEQMVREEGFLQDSDPQTYQAYLLGQRSDALLRLCRAYCGIQMHREKMTVSEAAAFFVENAYLSQAHAEIEAQRGVYEPDYVLYAIGKMEILRLRADCRAALEKQGKTFSLRQFHDQLLAHGQYPIHVLRRKMLPVDPGEPIL